MTNLADIVDRTADLRGRLAAFVEEDGQISYGELVDRIAAARAALQSLGVGQQDRVAIGLAYAPDFAVAFYATLGIGAVAVPMNPALTAREAAHYLNDSGARILVSPAETGGKWIAGHDVVLADVGDLLQHPQRAGKVPVDADDTAVILYTSGTTGAPKGAELTHANLLFNATVLGDPAVIGPAPGDVVGGILPLFHTMGLTILNLTLAAGAAMRPIAKFDARRVAELIAAGRITILSGVPTHLQMLMNNSDGLAFPTPLTRLSTAGSGLPQAVRTWAETRLGVAAIEGYGLTEASPAVTYNRTDAPLRTGAVGRPLPGVQIKIVDAQRHEVTGGEPGEIIVRGPNVMKGYWNNPEATRRAITDGWLSTGDVGRVDADGYLYIVDRLKQLIIRGGFNVYPGEVESVLQAHPAVTEAAVAGIPDERVGEEIVAFIVGATAAQFEDRIRDHVRANLAPYKTPRRYIFVADLPRTATGKIARTTLPSLVDREPED